MLKDFVARLLTSALGDVVKEGSINKQTVHIGIWSGHLELTDLALKPEILDSLGMPFTVRYARIGKIEVSVPWAQIGAAAVVQLGGGPITFKIEDVHVLVKTQYDWDSEANARRLRAVKQSQVQAAEAVASKQASEEKGRDAGNGGGGGGGPASALGNSWFVQGLLNRVLDSLHIEVRGVHIRFEDQVSNPSIPFCLGLALEAGTLGSAERSKKQHGKGRQGSGRGVVKVAQATSLAVYCNRLDSENLVSSPLNEFTDEQIDTMLGKLIPTAPPPGVRNGGSKRPKVSQNGVGGEGIGREEVQDDTFKGHRFILHPLHNTSYIILDSKQTAEGMTRIVTLQVMSDQVSVTLEDHVLKSLICLSGGLIRFENENKLGLQRPRKSVREDPRAWWHYSYEAVLKRIHDNQGKWDWKDMRRRRTERLSYVADFQEYCRLQARDCAGVDEEKDEEQRTLLKDKLREAEEGLSPDDIVQYRQEAKSQLAGEGVEPYDHTAPLWRLMADGNAKTLDAWFADSGPSFAALEIKVEAELGEAHLALGVYREMASPEETAFLRSGLQDVRASMRTDSRAGFQPDNVHMSVQSIQALSRTGGDDWAPMISRRNRKVGLRLKPVMSLEVLRGPTGSVWAYGAKVDVDEVEVRLSVSSSWLDTLRSFLDLPDVADSFSEVEVMAMNQLHTAKDQLDAKLEFLRRTHIRIKAEVKIHAPLLTILPPLDDPDVEHMAALQIEVDDITLKTVVEEDAVQEMLLPEVVEAADDEEEEEEDDDDEEGEEGLEGTDTAAVVSDDGMVAISEQQSLARASLSRLPEDEAKLDELYDKFHVAVTGVTVSLVMPGALDQSPAAVTPLLEPMTLLAIVSPNRLPLDPKYPQVRMGVETSDVVLCLSCPAMKQLEQLALSYGRSTSQANKHLEALREKIERLARQNTSISRFHSVSSFLSVPPSDLSRGPSMLYFGRDISEPVGYNFEPLSSPNAGGQQAGLKSPTSPGGSMFVDAKPPPGPSSRPSAVSFGRVKHLNEEEDAADGAFYDAQEDVDAAAPAEAKESMAGRGQARSAYGHKMSFADVAAAVMASPERLRKDESGIVEGSQDKELVHASFSFPKLQLCFGQERTPMTITAYDVDDHKTTMTLPMDTDDGPLLTMSLVNLAVNVHARSQGARLRMSFEEARVDSRDLPQDMPLLGIGPSLFVLPTAMTTIRRISPALNDTPPRPGIVRRASSNTSQRSSDTSSVVSSAMMSLKGPMARAMAPAESPKAMNLLLNVAMDGDSKRTGRPFRKARVDLAVARVDVNLDQVTLTHLIEVLGPLVLASSGQGSSEDDAGVCLSPIEPCRQPHPPPPPSYPFKAPRINVRVRTEGVSLALTRGDQRDMVVTVGSGYIGARSHKASNGGVGMLRAWVTLAQAGVQTYEDGEMHKDSIVSRASRAGGKSVSPTHSVPLAVEAHASVPMPLLFGQPLPEDHQEQLVNATVSVSRMAVLLPPRALLRVANNIVSGPLLGRMLCLSDQLAAASGPTQPHPPPQPEQSNKELLPPGITLAVKLTVSSSSVAVVLEEDEAEVKLEWHDCVRVVCEDVTVSARLNSVEECPSGLSAGGTLQLKGLSLRHESAPGGRSPGDNGRVINRLLHLPLLEAGVQGRVDGELMVDATFRVGLLTSQLHDPSSITFLMRLAQQLSQVASKDVPHLMDSPALKQLLGGGDGEDAPSGQRERPPHVAESRRQQQVLNVKVSLVGQGACVEVLVPLGGTLVAGVMGIEVGAALFGRHPGRAVLVVEAATDVMQAEWRADDTHTVYIARKGPIGGAGGRDAPQAWTAAAGADSTSLLLSSVRTGATPHMWLRAECREGAGSPVHDAKLTVYVHSTEYIVTHPAVKALYSVGTSLSSAAALSSPVAPASGTDEPRAPAEPETADSPKDAQPDEIWRNVRDGLQSALGPLRLSCAVVSVTVAPQCLALAEMKGFDGVHGSNDRPHALLARGATTIKATLTPSYDSGPQGKLKIVHLGICIAGKDCLLALKRINHAERQHEGVMYFPSSSVLPGTATEKERGLTSPLDWSVKVDTTVDVCGAVRRPVIAPCRTHVDVDVGAVDVWGLVRMPALENLYSGTIKPITDLFATNADDEQAAVAQSRSSKADIGPYVLDKMPIEVSEEDEWLTLPSCAHAKEGALQQQAAMLNITRMFEVTVKVRAATARLCVIDNLRQPAVPLLVLSLPGQSTLEVRGSDGAIDVSGVLRLKGKYLNRRTVTWEPLLEPWQCELKASVGGQHRPLPPSTPPSPAPPEVALEPDPRRAKGQLLTPCKDLALSSAQHADRGAQLPFVAVNLTAGDVVNLNVTQALLSTLVDVATSMSSTSAQDAAEDDTSHKVHLYWIENDTGVPLSCRVTPKQPPCGEAFDEQVIAPGAREPLRLPHCVRPGRGRGRGVLVDVTLRGNGDEPWPPLPTISMEDEGVYFYPLQVGGASQPCWVGCELSSERGGRLLRVRSTVRVENHCTLPLKLAVASPGGALRWEHTFDCGSTAAVPPHVVPSVSCDGWSALLSATTNVKSRAVSTSTSVPIPLAPAESSCQAYAVQLTPASRDGGSDEADSSAIHVILTMRREVDLRATLSNPCGQLFSLCMSPPVVFTNVLAAAVDVVLAVVKPSAKTSRLQLACEDEVTCRLEPGESHAWYGASAAQDVAVCVRITQEAWSTASPWSNAVVVKGLKETAMEKSVIDTLELGVKGEGGALLNACLEVVVAEGLSRSVALYAPYWIVNTTPWPLEFAHDITMALSSNAVRIPIRDVLGRHVEPPKLGGSQLSDHGGLLTLVQGRQTSHNTQEALPDLLMAGHTTSSLPAAVATAGVQAADGESVKNHQSLRLRVRVLESGAWSRPIVPARDAEGLVGYVEVDDTRVKKQQQQSYWQLPALWHKPARVHIHDQVRTPSLPLSITQRRAGGVFSRTKIVVVSSKVVLVNGFGHSLEVEQAGVAMRHETTGADVVVTSPRAAPVSEALVLPAGRRTSLYWKDRKGARELRVRLREVGWEWSGTFVPEVEGDTVLRLRNSVTGAKVLLQVRVTMQGSTCTATFRREPAVFAPYVVENRSMCTLWFGQRGSPYPLEPLLPYHAAPYAWDEPRAQRHLLELEWRQRAKDVATREVAGVFAFDPEVVQPVASGCYLRVQVVIRGPTKVLLVTDTRLAVPRSPSPPPLPQLRACEAWLLNVSVALKGVGVSIVDSTPCELLYASALDLQVHCDLFILPPICTMDSPRPSSVRLWASAGQMQVDDQLEGSTCPVTLVGEPPLPRIEALKSAVTVAADGTVEVLDDLDVVPPDGGDGRPDFVVLVEQDLRHDRVLFIRALEVSLTHCFHITVDGNLVAALLGIATVLFKQMQQGDSFDVHDDLYRSLNRRQRVKLMDQLSGVLEEVNVKPADGANEDMAEVEEDGNKVFVDMLRVAPVKMELSFFPGLMASNIWASLSKMSGKGSDDEEEGSLQRVAKVCLDALGSTLARIDHAPLELPPLTVHHASIPDLITAIQAKYVREVLRQAYVIPGALDVLGRPYGAITNLAMGLYELLHEPAKGLVALSVRGFTYGLVRGGGSLVGHVLLAAVETIQSIATSLRAGLQPWVLLLEGHYDGRTAMHTQKTLAIRPRRGMLRISSLRGIALGLIGIIYEPLQGGREGGVRGVSSGVARGVVAFFLRPALGLLDDVLAACQLLRAIVYAEHSGCAAQRVRPPRLFLTSPESRRNSFSQQTPAVAARGGASQASEMMTEVCSGVYQTEGLVWSSMGCVAKPVKAAVPEDVLEEEYDVLVVVTQKRILAGRKLGGVWQLEWQVIGLDVSRVESGPPTSVVLVPKGSNATVGRRKVSLPDKSAVDGLVKAVKTIAPAAVVTLGEAQW